MKEKPHYELRPLHEFKVRRIVPVNDETLEAALQNMWKAWNAPYPVNGIKVREFN